MKHIYKIRLLQASLLTLLLAVQLCAQTNADSTLLAEINRIRAIDNHAHPLPFLGEGEKDVEFDVPESVPPEVLPVRLRDNNPEYLEAWRVLYGYKYNDFNEAHLRELLEMKRRVKRERGENYPAWVLDQFNIETMFANRIDLGAWSNCAAFSVGVAWQFAYLSA